MSAAAPDSARPPVTGTDPGPAGGTRAPRDPAPSPAPDPAAGAEQIEGSPLRPRSAGRIVPRWASRFVIVAGALMLPWIAGLSLVLPARHEAAHYRGSWVGFDLVLCAMLLRTGRLARKGGERARFSATVTGTLLLVDCWFDVATADGHRELLVALVLALLSELPLAVFCFWIAGRVTFRLPRPAGTLFLARWRAGRSLERPVRPPFPGRLLPRRPAHTSRR